MTTVVVKEPYRLGDLDFARYFDHAIGVLQELVRPVAYAVLLVLVPPLLVFFVFDLMMGFSAGVYATDVEGMTPDAFLAFWLRGVSAVTGYSLIFQLLTLYLSAMVTIMAGMHYLGTPMGIRDAARFVWSRVLFLVIAHVVYFIVVTVGFMLCIVPGIYLGVMLYIFMPAILFEDAGPIKALSRSYDLISQGEFLRIFFIWLAMGFIGAPMAVLNFIIPEPAVDFMLQTLAGAAIQLFTSALITVVYFSLRCKYESLDLEILASHLDLEADAGTPAL